MHPTTRQPYLVNRARTVDIKGLREKRRETRKWRRSGREPFGWRVTTPLITITLYRVRPAKAEQRWNRVITVRTTRGRSDVMLNGGDKSVRGVETRERVGAHVPRWDQRG